MSPAAAKKSTGPAPLDLFGCALDGISVIEASAGTGKTWSICGLYLRLLLERDLEAQQILVVTFTNAATAELRERIRTRLVETLEYLNGRAPEGDPFVAKLVESVARETGRTFRQMTQRLEAALACFDEAAIYTIHGFCQRALADTPLAAGLPYGLELIEDDAELRHEAVADFWRRKVAGAQSDPDLAAFLAANRESPERWAKLLARLQAKPLSKLIWPDDLDAPVQRLRPAIDAAFAKAKGLWEHRRTEAKEATLSGLTSLNAASYKPEGVEKGAREWDAFIASGNPLYPDFDFEGKAPLFSAEILTVRTKKKGITPRHAFFDAAKALLELRRQIDAQLARLRLRLLRDMATEAGEQLRKKKRARRVVAFDDILYNAWDALCNGKRPWLAAALRERYPAALIDEFQDTDPLQCAIFMAIYDGAGEGGARGPLFLVGDPKQAIYSFRNADLHTYLQAKQRAQACHTLVNNQRSVEGLIKACNALFDANPGGFILPGIEVRAVSKGDKPRPPFEDRSEPGGAGAPLRLWRLPQNDDGVYLLRDQAQDLAVRATAAEISRLLRASAAGRIALDGRKLRAGDIAVLVRSHRQGSWTKRALGALGIGSVELSQESIFATRDAEEFEQVLASILEPAHQARLLAALATELMGANAGEIESLSRNDAALAERTTRFDELRKTWLARGFGFTFRRWMDEEGVSRRLLARADGERRLTNLLHLGELLHRASLERPAPDALLRWLATQRAEATSGEEAQVRLESDRNLVQIVTIHKAKGLEYGIVFCPFLWDGFQRTRSEPDAIEYHDEHGRGAIDFRPEASKDEDIRQRRREEAAAEDVRLAYVALTRAVHRCYLIAGCYLTKRGTSPKESTKSLLNWLATGADSSYAKWAKEERTTDAIEQAWRQIADAAKPHIRLTDMPLAQGTPLSIPGTAPESLNALPAPKHIDPGWRIGSFTGLATGAEHEAAASDHDARALIVTAGSPPDDLAAHDILRFPRGPSAGDCLHAMFERLDFADSSTWDSAIARALALHPQRARDASGPAPTLQKKMLRSLLDAVLATPLRDGIVLGQVPKNRRLNELGFSLPAAGLNPARLNGWLKAHQYPMPRLTFDALQGYLRGTIDLVFEHGGRYYVLDWKSNHLGYTPQDYGAERIAAAMQEHGYHLQYLLYSVAVHRYLARRIADYDYAKHFGGVLYLFVRGVRPGWRNAKDEPLGTWFHRPSAARLTSLDALLAGHPEAIAA